jgi:hypothetical protein
MDGSLKIIEKKEVEEEFSFKNYFVPLTNAKALTWIIIIGFIVYANILFNGFVWDDGGQLINNAAVQNGQYLYYFTHTIGPYYKPLMFFVYVSIHQFFYLNPFVYHLFQLILHIINSIFIFLLFRQFSKRVGISFILALLFLIHPINEEAVAYIADYQDVLFTFFGLAAILVTSRGLFSKYSNIVSAILLLCSLLSKETGILFVIICIIYTFIFRKESLIKKGIYFVGALIVYLLIRVSLVGFIHPLSFSVLPPNTILTASFSERLVTIPKIITYYITTIFYPNNLAVQYWYVISPTLSNFVLPLLFVCFIFGIFIFIGNYITRKQNILLKQYWFFFIWFTIGLGLHVQIIPLDVTAADRWFYFPFIGLLGMILSLLPFIHIKALNKKDNLVIFIIFVVFVVLSTVTIIRNSNWYNGVTLFGHDIVYAGADNVADIQYNYGTALMEENHYKDAIIHLQKASQLSPESYEIWQNLGLSYIYVHKYDQARGAYEKVISLNNNLDEAHRAILYTLIKQNHYKEAENMAKRYIKMYPTDYSIWRLLGLAAYKNEDKTMGITSLQKSFSLYADPETYNYLLMVQQNLPIDLSNF